MALILYKQELMEILNYLNLQGFIIITRLDSVKLFRVTYLQYESYPGMALTSEIMVLLSHRITVFLLEAIFKNA